MPLLMTGNQWDRELGAGLGHNLGRTGTWIPRGMQAQMCEYLPDQEITSQ